MKKAMLIFSVIVLAFVFSGFTFGHMDGHNNHSHMSMMGHGMMAGHGMMGSKMMYDHSDCPKLMYHMGDLDYYIEYEKELDLSKKQIESLESIRDKYQKVVIKRNAELEESQIDLNEILDEEDVNLSKAKALIKKIALLRADLSFLNIERYVKAKEVLNENQINIIESMESDAHHHSGNHRCCGM